ncbi:hypothetical protein ACSCB1_25250 [Streptomyces europaeiscabiei]|uniref:hypothetical protein n=1 Tax=Streptomyces europaeiscabiei TaxID=146819 RepID=UPI00062832D6|nr:hypothetical protein [Streptomyces europaeiscabiei]
MAEHDSEREPEEKGAPLGERHGDSRGDSPGGSSGSSAGSSAGASSGESPGEEQHVPFDEDAAWRAIVAGFGNEPPDPPGTKPFRSVEDLALLEAEPEESPDKSPDAAAGPAAPRPLGSSVAFAPGVGSGPRDYSVPDPVGEELDKGDRDSAEEDEDGEGHFVPPEPPPLPAADATAKFAWLGVIGGPVLLLLAVLLGWEMTWWLTTLGIGGFLGGFATLVMRMNGDDEDDDDPGRGAVV